MTFELDNALVEVKYRVADAKVTSHPVLTPESLTAAVRSSILTISRDLTPQAIAEFAGAVSPVHFFELLTSLPGWKDGFSSIQKVIYPAEALLGSSSPPNELTADIDWTIAESVVATVRTQYLYLPNHLPLSTELVRVFYTGLHTLSQLDGATSTSIPSAFESAFYDLCASHALLQIAADMARQSQPTVGADVVNNSSTVKDLRDISTYYIERYRTAIGASTSGAPAATDAWLNWNTNLQGGGDYLFHGRAYR